MGSRALALGWPLVAGQLGAGSAPVVPIVPGLTNLSGGAARVAITDATYWIRTGGTLARSTDAAFETNLKASSTNKTVPFAGNQSIPAGSIGYVSIKHADVTADVSPPLFINWDQAQAQPSAASPVTPTVWYSSDSTDGSPDTGTWAQDTSFAPFRPSTSSDAAYGGRGQRYFWPTASARWVQVRWDLTNAAITQAVLPQVCCSSGQWLWVVGMSIIRAMYSNISSVSTSRAQFISSAPGSDPFFFVTARSGANQQAIIDEQITPVTSSATLKKFIRGAYVDPYVNDVAYAGTRPYASQTGAVISAIRSRTDSIIASIKALNITVVAPDLSFLNFTSADGTTGTTPYVNAGVSGTTDAQAFQSVNGAFPYNTNVFGPALKTALPASWDAAYDLPFVSDYAGVANGYDTDTNAAAGDSVHPNGTGYTAWRPRSAPLWKLLYGLAPGQNTLQYLLGLLGASTATAKKARLQVVFDATYAMYPTADSTAQTNRANLRAQLDALTAT